jgi:hypothetical protein
MEEPLDSFKKNFRANVPSEYRSRLFANNKRLGLGVGAKKVGASDNKRLRLEVGAKRVGIEGMNIANMKLI